jgi:glycosyltransferase involved in cell wall biosynthesis
MHILIAALHRPSKPTGVCRHAANLAQSLAQSDKVTKVSLVIGAWQKTYFEKSFTFSSSKINLTQVDIKNTSLSRNSWFIFSLPKLAKQLQADIVHLSFPLPFLRNLFTCPVVSTIHDLYPYEFPENFGFPNVIFNQVFLNQSVYNSDGLSCVSQTTLETLRKYFKNISSRKKTTVIYNQVDFSNITEKNPSSATHLAKNSFLLSVAQHRKNKNLDILIKSYYSLRENNVIQDDTKLVIVGSSGPETENLRHLVNQMSLEKQVIMLASIDDSELCWLYKNCEMLIVPSSTEGFCLPLAEALSLGSKVVCSNIAIFKEIASSKCTFFNLEGDIIQNLSQAIIRSISEPHSEQMEPDYRFSKTYAAQKYINFYSQFI